MALGSKVIDIPLSGAMDEATDEHLVEPPLLARLENGVVGKKGAVSKRKGHEALTTPTFDARVYFDHYGQLTAQSPEGTYAYREDTETWDRRTVGSVDTVGIETQAIVRGEENTHNFDCAVLDGVLLIAWADNNLDLWIAAYEETNPKAVLLEPTKANASIVLRGADRPVRLSTAGNDFLLTYITTAGDLELRKIPSSTLVVSNAFTINASVGATAKYDIGVEPGQTVAPLILCDEGTETDLYLVDGTGVVDFLTGLTGNYLGPNGCCAWRRSTGRSYFAVIASDGKVWAFYTDDYTTAVTPVDTGIDFPSLTAVAYRITLGEDDSGVLIAASASCSEAERMYSVHSDFSSLAPGSVQTRWNCVLATKIARITGRTYLGVELRLGTPYSPSAPDAWLEPVCLLLRAFGGSASTFRVAGRYLQDVCANLESVRSHLGALVVSSDTNKAHTVQTVRQRQAGTQNLSGLTLRAGDLVTVDPDYTPTVVRTKSLSFVSGACLGAYDGLVLAENAPHTSPARPTVSGAGTGSNPPAGTYTYKVAYQWEDASGNLHRSAVSPESASITIGSPESIDIDVPRLDFTALSNASGKHIQLAVYRQSDTDDAFFLVKVETPVNSTDGFWRVTDSLDDDVAFITFNSETLENNPAPPLTDLRMANNRLWGLSGNTLYYSKQFEETVAPEFNAALTLGVPDFLGSSVALGTHEDMVVVFTEQGAFFTFGEGQTNLGVGPTLAPLKRLQAVDGCVDKRSVVETPAGTVFQSPSGIYLITADGSVQFIGEAIQTALGDSLVTSAVVNREEDEVRFTIDDATLVWNYRDNSWSIRTITTVTSATMWGNRYVVQPEDATLAQSTDYLDDEEDYDLALTTGWLHLAGLQGFQRIRRLWILGRWAGDTTVTVELGYDYADAFTHTFTIDPDDLPDLTDPFEYEIHVPTQKCSAIRLRIKDIGDNGVAGLTLTGLAIEVGVKKGGSKRPATLRQ